MLAFFMALFLAFGAQAGTKDSTGVKDTLAIYKKIQKIAYKHRFTRFLYHAIFVDPDPKQYEVKPLSDQQVQEDPNLKYKGMYIRKIEVFVYDPFGYSVNDTTRKKVNPLQRLGNRYHITTRHRIIRNLLLFKMNDTLELIKLNESERLLRAAGYVNDARIYVVKDSCDLSDSVDIKIVVQDKWSLDAGITAGPLGGDVTFIDKNIVGSGQRYRQYERLNENKSYEITGRYSISNISATYISSDIFYAKTNEMFQAGFSLDRSFYSSLSKWGGGILASRTWNTYNYLDTDEALKKTDLNYLNTDVWIGRGLHLTNKKVSSIITSLRYVRTYYDQRPTFEQDTARTYRNSALYLGSIGFSLSKYYKDQYIYRFGANEDIPEGVVVQVLYGLAEKELRGPYYYCGFDVSKGKHIEHAGYFSGRITYGLYFNHSVDNDATLKVGAMYFTDLLQGRKWYFRQFAYLNFVNGINKPVDEKITLRSDEMYGFNSGELYGKTKLIMNLESVSYAPYNLIGFRFAPLLLMGFGMLGSSQRTVLKGELYQSYAVGLLIRNENLLNSSFKISFGMYPTEPGKSGFSGVYNAVTSFSVKFTSFAIGKPETISYQ